MAQSKSAANKAKVQSAAPAAAPVIVTNTPEPNTGDFEHASRRVNSDVSYRDIQRKKLAQVYKKQELCTVMIAPMYQPYFGKRMHVSCNGISIAVPCNGRPYEIPKTFARVVQHRLRAINDQQSKQKRFSNTDNNVEHSPGELTLH